MSTNLSAITSEIYRRLNEPKISRVTIKAHPDQQIRSHGGFVSAEDNWEWGPEWRIGKRRGRWATVTDKSGKCYAVRVQWDKREPIVADWRMAELAAAAVYRIPDVERDDAKASMFAELTAFDAMCAELWERRDR